MMRYFIAILLCCLVKQMTAQNLLSSDSLFQENIPGTGRIWGYTFGDYFYKGHNDPFKRGENQYSLLKTHDNAFALRRVYLGYDFHLSKTFSTELLLAAEDWKKNEKIGFFIKYANVRWRHIWKNTDLIIGQSVTPSFSKSSEKFWSYRSIERTITDIRRTASFDFGIAIQGYLDKKQNYSYHLMLGNGAGGMADKDRFKKVYGNVSGYFLERKLLVNIYADYERMDWQAGFHHAQSMFKLFLGYKTPYFTVGAESFLNYREKDISIFDGIQIDTTDAMALGFSAFAHSRIIKDKLRGFIRFDYTNPYLDYQNGYSYIGFSKYYNPNLKEQFFTFGLDFTPHRNVHFMPNIWLNTYQNQQQSFEETDSYDLVYRFTFYYLFGK